MSEPYSVLFEWSQFRASGVLSPCDVSFCFSTRSDALKCAAWCSKVAAEGGEVGWKNARVTIYGLEQEEWQAL